MLRTVDHFKPPAWVRLYIERWLKAPAVDREGTRTERNLGTPQGGVISPVLANLFLHFATDRWMVINHPSIPFERYADDMVLHCRTKTEAEGVLASITERLGSCRLTVHPVKTKIVYCRDGKRKLNHEHTRFKFLGFDFQARTARGKFRVSALYGIFCLFSGVLVKWAKRKFKSMKGSWKSAAAYISAKAVESRYLFVHWEAGWLANGRS